MQQVYCKSDTRYFQIGVIIESKVDRSAEAVPEGKSFNSVRFVSLSQITIIGGRPACSHKCIETVCSNAACAHRGKRVITSESLTPIASSMCFSLRTVESS